MKLSSSQKIGASLAVSLLLLSSLAAASLRANRKADEAARWVEHTQDVESDLSDLLAAVTGAESAARGFILTDDPRYLAAYSGAPAIVREQIRALRRKITDNPVQQKHLDALEPLVEAKVAWIDQVTAAARENGKDEAVALIRTGRGREIMSRVRAELLSMTREEERLMMIRSREQESTAARMRRFILLTVGFGFGFVAAAAVVIQRDLVGRRRAENALRSLSLVDELTGLANRRGFFVHAEDRIGIAGRLSGSEALYFADLDGLKAINDDLGHAAGDEAIAAAATVLRRTFAGSDIVARLGGDEFAVLALLDEGETPESRADRLRERLAEWNAAEDRKFFLELSIGIVPVAAGASLDEILAAADHQMYAEKRSRRRGRSALERPARA